MLNNETIVWDFKTLWSGGGGGETSFTSLFSVFVVINVYSLTHNYSP